MAEKKTVWYFTTTDGWNRGELYAQRDKVYYLRDSETSAEVQSTKIEDYDPESEGNFGDMVHIPKISEPIIVSNLKKRYKADEIYTLIGPILLAVNPYTSLSIYTPEEMEQFRGLYLPETPYPHIFGVASTAYLSLEKEANDQAIIISGESGAGKTESSKYILQFLAHTTALGTRKSLSAAAVESRVLLANPILESFGNAKTLRNNNSSRFGKFLEVTFDKGRIVSAGVESYLLEKSRVAFQSKGERNYHVFYQLLRGGSQQLLKQISLPHPPEKFYYLNQGTTAIEDSDDAEDFECLTQAMDSFGFSGQDQTFIWGLLAFILHLGNVQFQKMKAKDSAELVEKGSLKLLSDLVGVQQRDFEAVLTSRIMTTGSYRKSTYNVPLNVTQAIANRDALSKLAYERLFNYVIQKINASLAGGAKVEPSARSIRILDIFGFEVFEENSLEQLQINYANEKLQQQFNVLMFKLEQQAYKKEGVKWEEINIIDNSPCLDMLEKRPVGFFPMLDEEGRVPNGSDDKLLQKLNAGFKDRVHWGKALGAKSIGHFIIKHYAGDVAYNISGFLEKNKDTVHPDLEIFFSLCENPFIKQLFKESSASKATVAYQFKDSLQNLVDVLSKCNLYYVRCIKPNTQKVPSKFDGALVLHQLQCLGILETLKLRKAGYSFRQPFAKFLSRYGPLLKTTGTPKAQCEAILGKFNAGSGHWALGSSVVFMREAQVLELENELFFFTVAEEWKKESTALKKWMEEVSREVGQMSETSSDEDKLSEMVNRVFQLKEEYGDKLFDYDAVIRIAAEAQVRKVPNISAAEISKEWEKIKQLMGDKGNALRLQLQKVQREKKEAAERLAQEEERRRIQQEYEEKRRLQEEEDKRREETENLIQQEAEWLMEERDYDFLEEYYDEETYDNSAWDEIPSQGFEQHVYATLPDISPEVRDAYNRTMQRESMSFPVPSLPGPRASQPPPPNPRPKPSLSSVSSVRGSVNVVSGSSSSSPVRNSVNTLSNNNGQSARSRSTVVRESQIINQLPARTVSRPVSIVNSSSNPPNSRSAVKSSRLSFYPSKSHRTIAESQLFSPEELASVRNSINESPPAPNPRNSMLETPPAPNPRNSMLVSARQSVHVPEFGPRIVSTVVSDLNVRKHSLVNYGNFDITIHDLNQQLDQIEIEELIVGSKKGKKPHKTAKKVQFFNGLSAKEDKPKKRFGFFNKKKKEKPASPSEKGHGSEISGPVGPITKKSLNYEDLEGFNWTGEQH